MMDVRASFASDVGCRREVNEDSVYAGSRIFAVADGMGGHAAGEVASSLTIGALAQLEALAEITAADLRGMLARANQDILESVAAHPERAGMGTTVTGLALVSFAGTTHWLVFNVGDSRVYRFADDVLTLLTLDHSEVAELLARGQITAEQSRHHSRGNVVTRALGMNPAPAADVWMFPPTAGERFLLCSDGLTTELPDERIEAVLRRASGARDAANELVYQAVAAGGRDNVSVIVVEHCAPAGTGMDPELDEDTVPQARREPVR